VFVHGFAAEKTENGLFPLFEKALASKGWVTLSYDWRGLGKSEGSFSETDLQCHAADFARIVDWLKKSTKQSRVSALGFSLGAAVIALGVERGVELDHAAFLSPALRPAVDMWPRYATEATQRELQQSGYIVKNRVQVGRHFLESLRDTDLAPPGRVFAAKMPLLVCHGTEDERIPFSTSSSLFHQSEDFHPFPGASHSFRPEETHRGRLKRVLLDWYAAH
jgi:pimeloyl-ACP methyl ester carboxylesterase